MCIRDRLFSNFRYTQDPAHSEYTNYLAPGEIPCIEQDNSGFWGRMPCRNLACSRLAHNRPYDKNMSQRCPSPGYCCNKCYGKVHEFQWSKSGANHYKSCSKVEQSEEIREFSSKWKHCRETIINRIQGLPIPATVHDGVTYTGQETMLMGTDCLLYTSPSPRDS